MRASRSNGSKATPPKVRRTVSKKCQTVVGVTAALLTITALTPLPAAHAVQYFWDADGSTTAATGGTGTWDAAALLWRALTSTGTLSKWPNTAANTDEAIFGGTAGTVTLGAT